MGKSSIHGPFSMAMLKKPEGMSENGQGPLIFRAI